MFIGDGEISSMVHEGKMFIDFDALVEQYLFALSETEKEIDPDFFTETDLASMETASMIGHALLNTLYLCYERANIESINDLSEIQDFWE